jgi:protein O-GlcNAc transferase
MLNIEEMVDSLNKEGVRFARLGNFEKADANFKEALTLFDNPNSYYFLGITSQKQNMTINAIKYYEKALRLNPKFSAAHSNLGGIYLDKKDYPKAISHLQNAASADPANSYAYCSLGNAFNAKGEDKKAIKYWQKSIDVNPNVPEGYFNLGIYYSRNKYTNKAIGLLNIALSLNPSMALIYKYLGHNYFKIGQYDKAVFHLEHFIKENSGDELDFAILGNCYLSLNRYNDSFINFNKSLKINPAFSQVQNDLGNYYFKIHELDKAIACYKKAIKQNSSNVDTYNNLGGTYLNKGEIAKALEIFNKAILLDPKNANSQYSLGLIYDKLGKPKLAAESFAKCYKLDNSFSMAQALRVFMLMQICDWKNYLKEKKELDKITSKEIRDENKTGESPFINVLRKDDLEECFQIAKLASQNVSKEFGSAVPPFTYRKHNKKDKIKIGYLSSDFYTHATSQLILGLFTCYDKNKFEIYTYSYGPNDKSSYRKTIEKCSDKFTDISNFGHLEAANLINGDGIDILVELKGHTQHSRLEICAMRPAPVQVSYLGFPGTTGATFIDYLITDKIVTPRSHAKYYSEKFAYLPNCYQINDNKKPISSKVYKRKDFGLPEKAFIFSSFNTPTKISPETFASWTRILKKTPNSILWLLESNIDTIRNLKRELQNKDVNPNRIYFAPKLPNREHLARLKLADLSLDTFMYNGHTTTSDSLWAEVPVITVQGAHFASRVASSILTAIGLPELITRSPKEYETLAIKIAGDKKYFEKIKEKLASNRLTKPLFNTEISVLEMEKLYLKMWSNHLKGRKVIHI